MFEHAFDDAVGALTMLGDFVEVAAQHLDDLIDRSALVVAESGHPRRRRLMGMGVHQPGDCPLSTMECRDAPAERFEQVPSGPGMAKHPDGRLCCGVIAARGTPSNASRYAPV